MSEETEIDLDLADIRTDEPVPADWYPIEDELPFDAEDRDENSDD